MQDPEQRRAWIVKRQLNADALKEYVAQHRIGRAQVVAITEPQDGIFTLIFEPTDEQHGQLEAEESQVAETLDTLFGPAVTPAQEPVQEPVQAPGGAEVETVVTIPASPTTPLVAPPTAPSSEPSPS
jgi:hypothetical protein